MDKCVAPPEWIVSIFWVFIATMMIAIILALIWIALNTIYDFFKNLRG